MEKMADDLCRLCLCCKLIKLESLQKNEILMKISKYLLIKMEQNTIALCANCYKSLEDFHKFYEMVHTAHRNFHLLISEMKLPLHVRSKSTQTSLHWNHIKSNNEIIVSAINNGTDENGEGEDENDASKIADRSNDSGNEIDREKLLEKKEKLLRQKELSSEIEKKMMEFYNIKCDKCEDIQFTSFKMLSRHYGNVHNMQGYIKCCKRNIKVNDKSYLRSHMLKHLEPDMCRCTICGKQLSSTVTLKHHMILHKPTEERPFQCSECDKRFCCKNDLKNHEKAIHLPENEREDFICDVCGKVFQKVANLRYHHSTIHLQERKYICELCAKCFTTQSGLRTHKNAAHNNRGPIQCQECNKWLKNEDTYQKHLQLHQNHSYPCSQCDKICNSSTSLRSHMVKHSESRPYSCNICRKSFKTKTHLKNHSVQHSGGSNFKCPFCAKTFVNMSNYYTHRKRMHFGTLSKERAKQGGKGTVLAKNGVTHLDLQELTRENFAYDSKIVREDSFGDVAGNEMPPARQNIIVSPQLILCTD